ncbi:MAG: nwsA [Gemmatimonadetes bacterium]|nr:nwsA [Gemmatimonadota bacterium]
MAASRALGGRGGSDRARPVPEPDGADTAAPAGPASDPRRSGIVRSYGVAVAGVAFGLLLSLTLEIPPLLIPAIVVSAWYGGMGPGMLAAVLSIVGSQIVLAQPSYTLRIATLDHAAYLLVFSLTALFVAWLTATQRRTEVALRRAHGELSQRVSDLARANERLHGEMMGREQAADALREAQADLAHVTRVTMLGEITASIAHDVSQPLAAVVINGGACRRWLDADPPNLAEARAAAERIVEDANRASQVVRRVRSLMHRQVAERTSIDVGELVRDTVALMHGELARHHVAVRTELREGLPPVAGDRVGLQQVLVNLMLNGIDAMSESDDERRWMAIRTLAGEAGGVVVEVEDAGRGVRPEDRDRIFEAFFSTRPGGLGMGLAISRSIVETHGGRLRAAPNEGAGTTLRVSLPAEPGGGA